MSCTVCQVSGWISFSWWWFMVVRHTGRQPFICC